MRRAALACGVVALVWLGAPSIPFASVPFASAQEQGASASRGTSRAKRPKRAKKAAAAEAPAARAEAKGAEAKGKAPAPAKEAKEAKAEAAVPVANGSAAATSERGPSSAIATGDDTIRKEGDVEVKTMEFTGLDIDGQLKTPQLLYFLTRLRAEFDRPRLPHRSFMPELSRSAGEKALR